MSFIQNFYTSRDNKTDGNTYVGQQDRLWYNPSTNSIYVNTANVPGGTPVALATGANIVANIITANTITNTTGNVNLTGNLFISGNISPASNVKIGGVKAGPGANISNDGTLTIDTSGLPLSFGDFTANNNILTLVNVDQNMILAAQGSAEIQLVGNIGFYKPDGLPPNVAERYFLATDDGQIRIFVPAEDPLLGAVEIIGSSSGNVIAPGIAGAMLHTTGQLGQVNRTYLDGNGNYVSIVGRRWNGNVATPTQVLADEDVLRINATAATNAGVGNVAFAQIAFHALENQTATAQGSRIDFTVTPVGSPATSRVDVASISVANGVQATKFTTAGTISATGNITGGNIIISNGGLVSSTGLIATTGNISAGNISTTGQISVTGNISAGNVNGYVTLPAGTANSASLRFTAGTLLTPPAPGVMSYDGQFFYATPQASERGLIVTQQIYILNTDYTIANQTGVQSMFGVSAAVSSNTRYAYVINAVIYKTSNNITMGFALDGNAVLSSHTYQTSSTASATLATLSTPSVLKNSITTGFTTPVVVTAALNGTGYYSLQVTGVISVTTGGTWNPLIAFSGLPGAGSLVLGGSQVEVWPVGTANTTVSIGNWT